MGDLLEDPGFERRLRAAVEEPTSPDARAILARIQGLVMVTTRRIPYSGSGGGSALSRMLANHRFFGPGVLFLTTNPSMVAEPLLYRVAGTTHTNAGDRTGREQAPPASMRERMQLVKDHPLAAALVYIRKQAAVIGTLVGIPYALMTDVARKAAPPFCLRPRGVLGPVSAYFVTHETSEQGAQHSHFEMYTSHSWRLLWHIATWVEPTKGA